MTAPSAPAIRSRPPTGAVPWPVVLVEGPEKSGKTFVAAILAASPRIGSAYWLDLNEGAGDEYAAIVLCEHCSQPVIDNGSKWVHTSEDWPTRCDGAKTEAAPGRSPQYAVLEHDGSYREVVEQITAVRAEAARAHAAGEDPVLLVMDTASSLWEGLKDWATERAIARATRRGKSVTAETVVVTSDLWNDASARYRRVMTLLLTFPGIVVLTARGKEVTRFENGQPVEGSKTWSVEGHKSLGYDVTAWVRMQAGSPGLLVGARSVYCGVRPDADKARELPASWSLEWLIFDAMRCDPRKAHVRDLRQFTGGDVLPEEQAEKAAHVEREAASDPVPQQQGRPAAQRPQQGRRPAAQPVAPERLPHALDPATATVEQALAALRGEVAIAAEVLGDAYAKPVERWAAAQNTTVEEAGVEPLLALARMLRPTLATRLDQAERKTEAQAVKHYLTAGVVDMEALLAQARDVERQRAEATPAA